jgi:heme exporter protein D
METTAHIDFIAAAYAAAVIVVGALVAWVTLDFRAQTRKIAELEMQGITRRSDTASGRSAPEPEEPAREQAEEEA